MKYIFWCAYEHLDFRIPEFEALSQLFNIELKWIDKKTEEINVQKFKMKK